MLPDSMPPEPPQSDESDNLFFEIIDEQDILEVDSEVVLTLCEAIFEDAGVKTGQLGVVLVDSRTIQLYNRDFLKHDYATDVISFPIEDRFEEHHLEGEVLACTEVAADRAEEFGWTAHDELLLYIVHGVLHLVGFDDQTAEQSEQMRQKEREYLGRVGVTVPDFGLELEEN